MWRFCIASWSTHGTREGVMNLPDRDALLYFEVACGCFEEAEELYVAGDTLAAIDSMKAGIKTIGLALQVVTTSKGREVLEEALERRAELLVDLTAEVAVDAGRVAVQEYCQVSLGV